MGGLVCVIVACTTLYEHIGVCVLRCMNNNEEPQHWLSESHTLYLVHIPT